jgi:hypothetical protein
MFPVEPRKYRVGFISSSETAVWLERFHVSSYKGVSYRVLTMDMRVSSGNGKNIGKKQWRLTPDKHL